MPGRIPQAFIDELVSRADIVELIGTRVPLKKAGREYRACCPFHDEKTPSFWVSPDKQFFHCFGCGAHGTALGFLMQYDQLPFPEAVEELAGRLGLTVPHEGGTAPAPSQHEELGDALGRVAGYYEETLRNNERARNYLRGRGLDAATIERFRIGYAPDAWNEVLRRFGATDESRQMLLATGLIVERDTPRPGSEAWYDRFRDRIMFPIRDPRGRMLGFGGRVLDKGEPKYLNSPETELFHKGRELYGLHEVRLARVKLERLLIVEGYMDVVRLHQAGVQYAVATLGTATTPEHLRRAFKLVNELVFCFDGDRAGRGAAWRALQNVLPEAREGREIRFLFLPDGEDPDSLVGKEGRASFEKRLTGAQPLSEYLLAHLSEQVDLSHADGQARLVALARPLLNTIPPGVYLELLVERLAKLVGLQAERLRQLLEASRSETSAAPEAPTAYSERPARHEPRPGGRGGLITQAIQILLHFPAAARTLEARQIAALAAVEQPGVAVLHELLAFLHDHPQATTAAVLERWRERAESRRLVELAGGEVLVASASAAGHELIETLTRLIDTNPKLARLDELTARANSGLSSEELQEYQSLISSLGGPTSRKPKAR
jgi:DNA primase